MSDIEGQMDVYDVLAEMGADPDHPTAEERAAAEAKVNNDAVLSEHLGAGAKTLSSARDEWNAEAVAERAAKLEEPLDELYPEGRTFYYEGTAPIGFIASIKNMFDLDVTVTVHVPADKLRDFNTAAAERGWPLGT